MRVLLSVPPVQIGPCRGGDSLLEVRVQPIALQGVVIWWSLPAVHDFLRGPKHQAFGVFRGKRWKVWMWVLKAFSQATQWLRESVRTMVCGANLASHVHALGPFCSCCCDGVLPMPKQGEWSSWLRHPRHFCHHGLV